MKTTVSTTEKKIENVNCLIVVWENTRTGKFGYRADTFENVTIWHTDKDATGRTCLAASGCDSAKTVEAAITNAVKYARQCLIANR